MTENKRFTIKPQDDLFGVVDNYSADKVCVINGIRTEIEAKWLCKDMNTLNDENEQLKQQLSEQGTQIDFLKDENKHMRKVLEENKELKQNLKQIQDSLWTTEYIKKLEKENNQLKQENNALIKLINDLGNEEMDRQMEDDFE